MQGKDDIKEMAQTLREAAGINSRKGNRHE